MKRYDITLVKINNLWQANCKTVFSQKSDDRKLALTNLVDKLVEQEQWMKQLEEEEEREIVSDR